MKKIKAVMYSRVSTKLSEQDTSYNQQQLYENEKYDIVQRFSERCTATNIKKRKGLLEMLKYLGIEVVFGEDDYMFSRVETTDIEIIACSSTSRLARNTKDAISIIEILHKHGVKIHFLDINEFSDNPQIEVLLNIYYTLDSQYSKELSRKVKFGQNRMRNSGYLFGGGMVKGYDLKEGKLIKNEYAEKIYNIFYDYANNNLSISKLAVKYDFIDATISGILKNKKYVGFAYNDDESVHENIEPIISLELYNKVQEVMKSRTNGNKGVNTNTYGLSSKCVCPICNINMSARKTYTGKKFRNWVCHSSTAKKQMNCSKPSISENRINKYLSNMVLTEAWRNNIRFRIELMKQDVKTIDTEALNLELSDIQQQLKKLLKLNIMGKIEESDYIEMFDELQDKKNSLEVQILESNDINNQLLKINKLEKSYTKELDIIEALIKGEVWDEVHKKVKNVYFDHIYNIRTMKKILVVKYITFKNIDIIDEYVYLDKEVL